MSSLSDISAQLMSQNESSITKTLTLDSKDDHARDLGIFKKVELVSFQESDKWRHKFYE